MTLAEFSLNSARPSVLTEFLERFSVLSRITGAQRGLGDLFVVISLGNQYEIGMRKRLRAASDEDLYRAAEAIVDAAICFQEAHATSEQPVPAAEFRSELIRAVMADPTLTLEIFRCTSVN